MRLVLMKSLGACRKLIKLSKASGIIEMEYLFVINALFFTDSQFVYVRVSFFVLAEQSRSRSDLLLRTVFDGEEWR